MADFIGRALVQVKADTTGFQRDVRTQIKKALDPVKATVNVTPTTVGFQAELRKQVRAAITNVGTFSVPVTPKLEAFRKSFLDEAKKSPIVIPAVADTKLLRAQLVEKVATINAGLAVRIPVIAGDESDFVERTGGGGGGKGKDETSKQTAEEKEAIKVKERLAASQAAVTEATTAGLAVTQRDIALKQALTEAEAAQSSARKLSLKVVNDETKALFVEAQGQVAAVTAVKDRIRAEGQLSAILKRLNNDLRGQVSVIKNSAQASRLETAIKSRLVVVEEALRRARAAGDATAEKALLTQRQSLVVQQAAASNAVTVFGQQATAAKTAAAAQRDLERAAARAAASQRFVARGALATALSFLKVRGATLAANSSFLIGAAGVAVLGKALQSAAALEQELNVFAVTAQATGDQLKQAGTLARELGADISLPAVSAGDAAQAMSGLAKAGLEVEDVFGGVRGTLQLATAAQIDNAEATELVASALNAFQLQGQEAVRVADLLTGAANESQGSISDMGIALQQSAAAAHQAGLSLEDTIALLTLLARAGLRGSDAGTSLRTALLRLIRPTTKAQDELDKLGVAIRDSSGNVRAEVFAELSNRLGQLGRAQRDATLAMIFGQDAFRSAAILGRSGAAGLDAMREATQKQGLAAQLAGARTQGLTGKLEGLRNNLATLGTTIGDVVLPPLGLFIESLSKMVELINRIESADTGVGPLDFIFESATEHADAFHKSLSDANKDLDRLRGFIGSEIFEDSAVQQAEDVRRTIGDVTDQVEDMIEAFNEAGGGPSALHDLALGIQGIIDELSKGGPAAQQVAARLQVFLGIIQRLNAVPDISVKAILETSDIKAQQKEIEGDLKKVPEAFIEGFRLAKNPIVEEWENTLAALVPPTKLTAAQIAAEMQKALAQGLGPIPIPGITDQGQQQRAALTDEQVSARLAPFEFRTQRAKTSGNVAEITAALKAERAEIKKILATQNLRLKDRTTLLGRIESINSELTGIQNDIASEQQDASNKLNDAREKAHQALIDGFNLRITRQQNVIAEKALTASLNDDLAAVRKLKSIIRGIINSGKLRASELVGFKDALIAARADEQRILDDIANAQKQAREDRQDALRRSFELDVDLAQTRGNVAGEIRARQKLIAFLQKLKNDTKRGTVAWKELRNAIAEERAAIKELKGEKEDEGRDLASLQFEFLQSQRGFFANFFGNVLPIGSTAGLVGNVETGTAAITAATAATAGNKPDIPHGAAVATGPQGPLSQAAARAEARGGPTRGQAATEVELLRQVVMLLSQIAARDKNPEAKRSRIHAGGRMETV